MASDINVVQFTGRCVGNCESRSDGKVAGFSVAINRSVRQDDGSWEDKVDFVDVSAFNGLAARCIKNLRKGDKVTIAGRLSQSTWKTDDGSKRSKLGIVATQIVTEAFYRPSEESGPDSSTDPEANNASIDSALDATAA